MSYFGFPSAAPYGAAQPQMVNAAAAAAAAAASGYPSGMAGLPAPAPAFMPPTAAAAAAYPPGGVYGIAPVPAAMAGGIFHPQQQQQQQQHQHQQMMLPAVSYHQAPQVPQQLQQQPLQHQQHQQPPAFNWPPCLQTPLVGGGGDIHGGGGRLATLGAPRPQLQPQPHLQRQQQQQQLHQQRQQLQQQQKQQQQQQQQQRLQHQQQQQQQQQRQQMQHQQQQRQQPPRAPAPVRQHQQQQQPPPLRAAGMAAGGPIGRARPQFHSQHQQHQPPPPPVKSNLLAVPSAAPAASSSAAAAAQKKTLSLSSSVAAKKSGTGASISGRPQQTAAAAAAAAAAAGAVGTEYVVQIRTELRGASSLQYHCRLCDCRFTDPQARDLHVKGRRHRLQFKRKVDPRLDVDTKPSVKARRAQDGGAMQSTMAGAGASSAAIGAAVGMAAAALRGRRLEDRRLREMQALEWSNFAVPTTATTNSHHHAAGPAANAWGSGPGPGPARRPETADDRHVLAKHSSVYPTELELQSVQRLVTRCERALKLVSDQLAADAATADVSGGGVSGSVGGGTGPLRGVMRVGVLAKGLLLHGDLATQLVLLCADRPTRALRDRVLELLPERLAEGEAATANDGLDVADQKLDVRLDEEDGSGGALLVSSVADRELACSVCLTSPAVREPVTAEKPEPEDMLDREKCLDALAALRQAKWFQAKASSLQSCVMLVRVLRDMCQRLPVWSPLSEWAMELVVERSLSSAGSPLSPGAGLRRVMECLAAGLLLPGGPGVRDPCEKSPVDAAAALTPQEREDLTASAQQALRLIAYRQVHQLLDMQPLLVAAAGGSAAPPPASGVKRPAATNNSSKNNGTTAPAAVATAAKQARMA